MVSRILLALILTSTAGSSSAAKLTVSCGGGEGAFKSISSALAHLNPLEPNTVTVRGACRENVVIQRIDRLTLIAAPGASINDASAGKANVIDISDSQRVSVQGFTVNGGADGVDCHAHSLCSFSKNTIQGSAGEGVSVRDSAADFSGDVLRSHAADGLEISGKGSVSLNNVTLQSNAGAGANVGDGSSLSLFSGNTIQGNLTGGILVSGGSRLQMLGAVVTGNVGDGVGLGAGSTAFFSPFFTSIVIGQNTGHGVSVGNLSFARFNPGITVSGNATGPDVLCYEKFAATSGALANLGGGATNCTEQ